MNYTDTEIQIEQYVTQLFGSLDTTTYPYHNLDHTIEVVSRVKEINSFYKLNSTDAFITTVAAWFHDTGYVYVGAEGHEKESIRIMLLFLTSHNIEEKIINAIAECINATKFPPRPTYLLENILCDADTYHFGTERFQKTDVLVKKEIELHVGKSINNWIDSSITLLQKHTFFTDYCRELLNKGKLQNILWLQSLATGEQQ